VRVVDHVLADADELAAEEEVVDGAPVVLGVDDGDDRGGELDQVLGAADLGERAVLVTGLAIWPRSISLPMAAKIRPCAGSAKCSGLRKSPTRS
jgi:hypothetical protein